MYEENIEVAKEFHKFLHRNWRHPLWLGVVVEKFPTEMWIYQELIYDVRPTKIIETGSGYGGSALFFPSIFDLLGQGQVISIDIQEIDRPKHPRIKYIIGTSISEEVFSEVRKMVKENDIILVSLDSEYYWEHVLKELELYSQLVTVGSYIVVEDTNDYAKLPILKDDEIKEGPRKAVDEFLKKHPNFIIDRSREKFYISCCLKGYLRRIY
jgi:cephalosporin hydroxylase